MEKYHDWPRKQIYPSGGYGGDWRVYEDKIDD